MKEFSDEIIVVDTGSEDRTVELAQAGGATVYHFAWCNDFSAAKNYALDRATGDWIVFLDADEYFGESIKAKFRATLELIHGNQKILGIDSLLYNIDADRNNEIKSTANQKRIFRNMKQLRYQGRIHEYLAYTGKKAMGFAYSEKFAIYHTGYSQSLTKSKNQRNLDMLLADIEAEGGEKPTHYSYLSVSYFNLQQYDKAIHYAKLAVKAKNKGIKSAFIKQYWLWLKSEQIKHSPITTLQQIVEAALTDIPDHPDFLWEDAKIALQRRDFILAEKRIVRIFSQLKNKTLMREYESIISGQVHIVYAALGKILETKGQTCKAIDYYKKALLNLPYKENVLKDMLKLLRDQNPKETLHWLNSIYDRDKDRFFLARCLKDHPKDALYAYYMRPQKNSYEELMGKQAYFDAAKNAGEKLSYILGSSEYLGSDAIVAQAAEVGSDLILALLPLSIDSFKKCTTELELLPKRIQKILLSFHDNTQMLHPNDAPVYHAILGDVLQYSSSDIMDRFGLLARNLDEENILQTAVKLYDKRRWQTVLDLYEHVSEEHKSILPGFWYYTGLCYFYLGNRKDAYDYLLKAQQMGMKSPDLPSYLVWCQHKNMTGADNIE